MQRTPQSYLDPKYTFTIAYFANRIMAETLFSVFRNAEQQGFCVQEGALVEATWEHKKSLGSTRPAGSLRQRFSLAFFPLIFY
jgi:hypothetical protein